MLKMVGFVVLASTAFVGVAHAQYVVEVEEEVPSGIPAKIIHDHEKWPSAYAKRPLTLPTGMWEVGGDLGIYVRSGGDDRGTTLPNIVNASPRLSYGVAPLVTLSFAQATSFVIVPDLDDPSVVDKEKVDASPLNFLVDGVFKIFGAYDIGIRAGLAVNRGYRIVYDFTTNSEIFEETLLLGLRAAVEGRVVFASSRANFRFRAGIFVTDVADKPEPVPDIDLYLLYQTTPQFMIGIRVGVVPLDWQIGQNDEPTVPLQLVGLFNLAPQFDLLFRGGLVVADHEEDGATVLSVGANFRL